jgi:hypothetical protein
MSDSRRFARPGRLSVLAMLGVLVLAGVAIVAVHPWRSDAAAGQRQPASVKSLNLPGTAPATGAVAKTPAVRLPTAADNTAMAAVASYLRARSDGDAATSYALLAPASLRSYPSQATWLDALPDLPPPTTFTVMAGKATGAGMDVSVDVRRTPVLNSFVGFVPAHAVEVYRTSRSGAAWRVEATPVGVRPDLISDRTAAADVSAWLNRLAACDGAGAAALQVSPDLLGDDTLPGAICTSHARLRAGPAQPVMGGPSTAPFLAAYGPEIGSWGRLIPVTGPGQQLLVGVAPLGRSWRVFGIVSGGTG